MSKPIPPTDDAPQGPPVLVAPANVQAWLERQTPRGPPTDPGFEGGPQPLGPATPPYETQEYLDSAERALSLTDERVLCTRCRHGWIMAEVAPTKNQKPDGTPFLRYKGFCTYAHGRMSLGDVRPVECNRFEETQPK